MEHWNKTEVILYFLLTCTSTLPVPYVSATICIPVRPATVATHVYSCASGDRRNTTPRISRPLCQTPMAMASAGLSMRCPYSHSTLHASRPSRAVTSVRAANVRPLRAERKKEPIEVYFKAEDVTVQTFSGENILQVCICLHNTCLPSATHAPPAPSTPFVPVSRSCREFR